MKYSNDLETTVFSDFELRFPIKSRPTATLHRRKRQVFAREFASSADRDRRGTIAEQEEHHVTNPALICVE
ncbi:hypothetical protein [Lignipirellula cremea]|uniref:hypothetical protein n=1 Tax=Lignipirellula cremea TaxID=2528010 RepID=UPI0011A91E04|nr:hypothetical protein [Lignipirellula cremea]